MKIGPKLAYCVVKSTENRFNMGMLLYKLPLIVIVAAKSCIVNRQFGVKKLLLRVVLGDLLCTGHVILRMRSKLCSLHNGKTLFFYL